MGRHSKNVGQQSLKEVKMWKMSQGSSEQKIDEEMGWYDKSISPQAHGVTRNKKRGKAISSTMKWYGRIHGQGAHRHRKEKNMSSVGR